MLSSLAFAKRILGKRRPPPRKDTEGFPRGESDARVFIIAAPPLSDETFASRLPSDRVKFPIFRCIVRSIETSADTIRQLIYNRLRNSLDNQTGVSDWICTTRCALSLAPSHPLSLSLSLSLSLWNRAAPRRAAPRRAAPRRYARSASSM